MQEGQTSNMLFWGIGILVVAILVVLGIVILNGGDKSFKNNQIIKSNLTENETLVNNLLLNEKSKYEKELGLENLEILDLNRGKTIFRMSYKDYLVEFLNFQGNIYFKNKEFVGANTLLLENSYHFFPENPDKMLEDYLPKKEGETFNFKIQENKITSYFNEKEYVTDNNSINFEEEYMNLVIELGKIGNDSVELHFRTSIEN